MIPDLVAARAPAQLFSRVGGFFTNTARGVGFCAVCTGPAVSELCAQCRAQRREYGDRLANLVVPLAYARGHLTPVHQSETHLFRYKAARMPSIENRQDLQLMIRTATWLRGACIAAVTGWWDVLTFVPSESRPGNTHPVVELTRQVAPFRPLPERVMLDIGPDIATEPDRWPMPTRFTLPTKWHDRVAGRHVLVVDDTWVSGGKAQSAAIALKDAGASRVTILCVARWLSQRFSEEHRTLIKSLTAPYDAARCPVTGGDCAPILISVSPALRGR